MAKKTIRQRAEQDRRRTAKLLKETDQTVGEVVISSVQTVKLRLVTYTNVPYAFVDVRMFWRAYAEDGKTEILHPSRKGIQIKLQDFEKLIEGFISGDFEIPEPQSSH